MGEAMRRSKQRPLAAALSLAMLFSLFPTTIFATEPATETEMVMEDAQNADRLSDNATELSDDATSEDSEGTQSADDATSEDDEAPEFTKRSEAWTRSKDCFAFMSGPIPIALSDAISARRRTAKRK